MTSNPPQTLLICPYCPEKPRASRRTALYKVKHTSTGKIIFRCMACNKEFNAQRKGDYVIRAETLQVIKEEI